MISIHALLAESDLLYFMTSVNHSAFLSTLSLRRATVGQGKAKTSLIISIHALLAESDARGDNVLGQGPVFLSTLSLRRATFHRTSIPALLGKHFYPRSPCGERHSPAAAAALWSGEFLSTLSLRRATCQYPRLLPLCSISIHALLAESDLLVIRFLTLQKLFLSTLSLRRATGGSGVGSWPRGIFLSTLSLRRATVKFQLNFINQEKFLSTLSLRRATGLRYPTQGW